MGHFTIQRTKLLNFFATKLPEKFRAQINHKNWKTTGDAIKPCNFFFLVKDTHTLSVSFWSVNEQAACEQAVDPNWLAMLSILQDCNY